MTCNNYVNHFLRYLTSTDLSHFTYNDLSNMQEVPISTDCFPILLEATLGMSIGIRSPSGNWIDFNTNYHNWEILKSRGFCWQILTQPFTTDYTNL